MSCYNLELINPFLDIGLGRLRRLEKLRWFQTHKRLRYVPDRVWLFFYRAYVLNNLRFIPKVSFSVSWDKNPLDPSYIDVSKYYCQTHKCGEKGKLEYIFDPTFGYRVLCWKHYCKEIKRYGFHM